jgi:hypothetical protein
MHMVMILHCLFHLHAEKCLAVLDAGGSTHGVHVFLCMLFTCFLCLYDLRIGGSAHGVCLYILRVCVCACYV